MGAVLRWIMHRGYIKLWRKMEEWAWYKNGNTIRVFLHLLIRSNHKDSTYQGCSIPRGSIVTGLHALSYQLNISVRSIRTSLSHLKSTNDITINPTSKFSVVSIVNYQDYQSESTNKITNKLTNDRQAIDKQSTTSKECKNDKNDKNNTIIVRYSDKPSSLEEVKAYFLESGANNSEAEHFFDYFLSNGWKVGGKANMKDWKAAARNWLRSPYRNKSKPNMTKAQQRNIDNLKSFNERMKDETRDLE